MNRWIWRSLVGTVLLAALLAPPPARALSVWSRKYATSCATCHTVYPKLTQFGEAFRRNGYRFPAVVDSDYIKSDIIAMGQDAAKKDFPNAVWPSYMTAVPMVGFGISGRITTHPDTSSAAAVADNKTQVSFDRLANSASIWASSNIDDAITATLMVGLSDTAASIDEVIVVWSDIVGPKHAAALTVGYAVPTLSAFSRGSSYAAGASTFSVAMSTLFNDKNAAFRVTSKYNLAELNGILGGRFEYGAGLAAGGHVDGPRPAENFYGHLAYKFGGMRLDGEGSATATDPARPWTEKSFTLHGFAYRSNTRFNPASPPAAPNAAVVSDRATTFGGGMRFMYGSAELNLGALYEDHAHVSQALDGAGLPGPATQQAYSAELAYTFYQWLVAAVRAERVTVKPQNLAAATDTRLLPVVAMQLRANMKLAVTGTLESCSGKPTGGGDWSRLSGSGIYLKPVDNTTPLGFQLSSVVVSAALGF